MAGPAGRPTPPPMMLMHAAQQGSLDGVRAALAAGADVNVTISERSALHLAAAYGHIEVTQFLLAQGADVHAKDAKGRTAEVFAMQHSKATAAVLADARRARGTQPPPHPSVSTPEQDIVRAFTSGDAGAVAAAFKAGVLTAASQVGGRPVLHAAVACGYAETVKVVLAHGGDPALKDAKGRTAEVFARAAGAAGEALLALLTGAAAPTPRDRTADVVAAMTSGDLASVKRAVESGVVSVDAVVGGRPLLHAAAGLGHVAILQCLLQLGADPALKDAKGRTAMQFAQQYQAVASVAVLEAFAEGQTSEAPAPQPTAPGGFEDLFHAVMSGDLERVRALVQGGTAADMMALTDAGGKTPLHVAAAHGRVDIVQFFLKCGADTLRLDAKGRTAAACAEQYQQPAAAKMIHEAANAAQQLFTLSHAPDATEAAVAEVLQRGWSVNPRTADGKTPLHHAASHGRAAVVRALLAAGCDVSAKDAKGRTAEAIARQYNQTVVADMIKGHVDGGMGAPQQQQPPPPPPQQQQQQPAPPMPTTTPQKPVAATPSGKRPGRRRGATAAGDVSAAAATSAAPTPTPAPTPLQAEATGTAPPTAAPTEAAPSTVAAAAAAPAARASAVPPPDVVPATHAGDGDVVMATAAEGEQREEEEVVAVDTTIEDDTAAVPLSTWRPPPAKDPRVAEVCARVRETEGAADDVDAICVLVAELRRCVRVVEGVAAAQESGCADGDDLAAAVHEMLTAGACLQGVLHNAAGSGSIAGDHRTTLDEACGVLNTAVCGTAALLSSSEAASAAWTARTMLAVVGPAERELHEAHARAFGAAKPAALPASASPAAASRKRKRDVSLDDDAVVDGTRAPEAAGPTAATAAAAAAATAATRVPNEELRLVVTAEESVGSTSEGTGTATATATPAAKPPAIASWSLFAHGPREAARETETARPLHPAVTGRTRHTALSLYADGIRALHDCGDVEFEAALAGDETAACGSTEGHALAAPLAAAALAYQALACHPCPYCDAFGAVDVATGVVVPPSVYVAPLQRLAHRACVPV